VAFSFGAFIEGAAGFGAPVAISAAFLVGLGFEPFQAALLCLIANTAPVAWGAIGTPIRTLASVTGLDVEALSAACGRILPFLSFILPFWLVKTMVSWRETFAVWPALVVVGGAFAASQYVWSNFVGFELVDIVSSAASLAAGVVLFRFWKPTQEGRCAHDREGGGQRAEPNARLSVTAAQLTPGRVAKAWMPFALLTITVLFWGIPEIKALHTPAVKDWMDAHTSWKPAMPRLHLVIAKGEAVGGSREPKASDREKAILDVVPVSSTGTAVFLAAVVSGLLLGVNPATLATTLVRTVVRLITAIAAIL
jgi:lactate permease